MEKDCCSNNLNSPSLWEPPHGKYGRLLSDFAPPLKADTSSAFVNASAFSIPKSGLQLATNLDEPGLLANQQHLPLPCRDSSLMSPFLQPANGYHGGGLVSSTIPNDFQSNPVNPSTTGLPLQRKFIVFDQSGSHRSVFISSINSFPVFATPDHFDQKHGLNYESANAWFSIKQNLATLGCSNANAHEQLSLEESKVVEDDNGTEMHENTADLEALMSYEDAEEEDEIASTGHSPSTILTGGNHLKKERDEDGEAIANSVNHSKRRKLDEPDAETTLRGSITNTLKVASSTKLSGEEHSLYSIKPASASAPARDGEKIREESHRLKVEKIRKAVSILRKLLPNGECKDAIVVLDEAIRYLRTTLRLKLKALDCNSW